MTKRERIAAITWARNRMFGQATHVREASKGTCEKEKECRYFRRRGLYQVQLENSNDPFKMAGGKFPRDRDAPVSGQPAGEHRVDLVEDLGLVERLDDKP